MRSRNVWWWLVVALALLVGCSKPAPPATPPPSVGVAHPIVATVVEWDEYTARLSAIQSVEVRARVSGYLQSIHFADGAVVSAGDLLFVVDPRPYEAVLNRARADLTLAEARLDLARKDLTRAEFLVKSRAISQEEADTRAATLRQAVASVGGARAAVDAAALDVEFTHVTAPIGGRVSRHLVTEGNLIVGGGTSNATLLTSIVSLDPVYAYFEVDEQAYLKYSRLNLSGQRPSSREVQNPVEIGVADEPNFPHHGWMDFVDNQIDPSTGTMQGRAIVPNPDLLLSPGQFVRLRLAGSGRYEAVLAPDDAIATDQAQRFVWALDGENRAQYRKVTLGPLYEGKRIIREGLKGDDRIVVSGLQRVRPNIVVAPEDQPIPPCPNAPPLPEPPETSASAPVPSPTPDDLD
jgi:RND family efflux transporter MFP subunit